MDLFESAARKERAQRAPLAERMRPRDLDDIVGLDAVLGRDAVLRRLLTSRRLVSLILWGPPGAGKTTLARILARRSGEAFETLSATASGVKDLREVVERARERAAMEQRGTVLFLDEIHRFNKAQQDALLPHVEDGTLVLIGATTENPSFEVNRPLLSRCRLITLQGLDAAAITTLLRRALEDRSRGLGSWDIELADPSDAGELAVIARLSGGDARAALNLLEASAIAALADAEAAGAGARPKLSAELIVEVAQRPSLAYDKSGEEHYNCLSALHKSLRGSDPDAALHYIARMLEAGEDPLHIARRLVRFASEDVGMADPGALSRAVAAWQAYELLGKPEGELALAQAAVDLATAPRSNALELAYQRAQEDVREHGAAPVPLHLRNVKTGLTDAEKRRSRYLSPHAYRHGVVPQRYLPAELEAASERLPYLRPTPRDAALEARLAELERRLKEAHEAGKSWRVEGA